MNYKEVRLAKGKERALQRKHPWIFSGAIASEKHCEEGDIVRIVDSKGEFLAVGHYMSPKASIRVKVLTYLDELIDLSWWKDRIRNAFELRQEIGLTDSIETNAYRLFFGEGDFVPGIVMDWYDGHVVLQAHTLGVHNQRDVILAALKDILGESLKTVYDKSGESLHHEHIQSEFLFGNTPSTTIRENGNSFVVNWVEGQKTGFFLDQRDNRQLVGHFSKGKKVLNAFAYTGGFSVYALNAGAKEVHSVDLSELACRLADENAKLNRASDRHTSEASDVQVFLKSMDRDYDIVILDPPAFAKRRKAVHNAIQAYKRLNASAIKNMRPGSILFTFSCSQNVTPQVFADTLRAAAIEVGRPIQILKELRQPACHPENLYFPEGHYLKGLMLRVL
ncbi:class I SAM-dependent rRNA methyltransferase [Phaeocystidibacter luteus]|uniref:Class I SAM-dependent rRNA methyltransferase n=1 Tax=Phaeocystidibacter luteus TaxID=911197 RepID=A0A6N6RG63_9FLAO|nr:class I SAM-dependent rRNA methyltransferase [Phaeocystidibacter luteus]KAB2807302.1 class I SAM-dependent rRNA methyltransferase [Phaeocystidibacter luteus]